jgi:hypothetical protein
VKGGKMAKGRIAFRSDERHPYSYDDYDNQKKNVPGPFTTGFWPRGNPAPVPSKYTEKYEGYRSREPVGYQLTPVAVKPGTNLSQGVYEISSQRLMKKEPLRKAGDIVPGGANAVCLSQRVSAAALFPFGKKWKDTWMYAVFIPHGREFSTHNRQIHDGWRYAQINPYEAWWCIYAHEIAVPWVPVSDIIAAVKCERMILGYYTLIAPVKYNKLCKIDQEYRKSVKDFLEKEIKAGRQERARPGSGFHKSIPESRLGYEGKHYDPPKS